MCLYNYRADREYALTTLCGLQRKGIVVDRSIHAPCALVALFRHESCIISEIERFETLGFQAAAKTPHRESVSWSWVWIWALKPLSIGKAPPSHSMRVRAATCSTPSTAPAVMSPT